MRVLMRSLIKNRCYQQEPFINDFIAYMTDPHSNKDNPLRCNIMDLQMLPNSNVLHVQYYPVNESDQLCIGQLIKLR